MKKTTLIALGLAILLFSSFVLFDVDHASALFASGTADCDGDGTVDVTCSGGVQCSGTDGIGCACLDGGGNLVSVKACPQK